MKRLIGAALAAVTLACAGSAGAATHVADFDDIAAGTLVPQGYSGVNWAGFSTYSNPNDGSGFETGITSGNQAVFGTGLASIYLAQGTSFNIWVGYYTSALNDGASLLIEGLQGATVVASYVLPINSNAPSGIGLGGFTDLTSVRFSVAGGGDFIIDDLQITTSGIPEPATWAMMIAGFGMAGAALRRRPVATYV